MKPDETPTPANPRKASLGDFLAELKRRRVFRALLGWGIFAFAVLQVVEPVMHALDLKDWALKIVVAFLAIGFPVTAAVSWAFDLRSTGIVKTAPLADGVIGASGVPRGTRLGLVLLVVGLGAAAPGFGWIAWHTVRTAPAPARPSDERLTVAVADFDNRTSDPELDGLSDLLITSLEQSKRLRVLTRSRMVDFLRAAGRDPGGRIDEALAREVGRKASARALILASIRKLGETYVFELRALDPERDEYLFTVREQAIAKGEVLGLVDRLSERVRIGLRESEQEVAASGVKVAEAVTGSLEAHRHYFEGLRLVDRLRFRAAQGEFRKALEIDPTFALAHAALAGQGRLPVSRAEQEQHVRAAAANRARLPDKDRLFVQAEEALFFGRLDEADALYGQVLKLAPEDKRVEYRLAQLHYVGRDDPAAARPHLERALALDPGWFPAQDELAFVLMDLEDLAHVEARVREWSERWPSAEALALANHVALRMGRLDVALDTAQRAASFEGGQDTHGLLTRTLFVRGDFDAAEAAARSQWSRDGRFALGSLPLPILLYARGKRLEALRLLDEVERSGEVAPVESLRVGIALADGDPGRAIELAERARALVSPVNLAASFAVAGQPDAAERFLGPGAIEAAAFQGLVPAHWIFEVIRASRLRSQGNWPAARQAFEAMRRRRPFSHGTFGTVAFGETCFAEGDDACASEALGEALSRPGLMSVRSGRRMLMLALALERQGKVAEARKASDRLMRLVEGADPDLPLLAEARALCRKLGCKAPE